MVKNLLPMRETWAQPLDWEDPLEKAMATRCGILFFSSSVLPAGKSHGQRSLVATVHRVTTESDVTGRMGDARPLAPTEAPEPSTVTERWLTEQTAGTGFEAKVSAAPRSPATFPGVPILQAAVIPHLSDLPARRLRRAEQILD